MFALPLQLSDFAVNCLPLGLWETLQKALGNGFEIKSIDTESDLHSGEVLPPSAYMNTKEPTQKAPC